MSVHDSWVYTKVYKCKEFAGSCITYLTAGLVFAVKYIYICSI